MAFGKIASSSWRKRFLRKSSFQNGDFYNPLQARRLSFGVIFFYFADFFIRAEYLTPCCDERSAHEHKNIKADFSRFVMETAPGVFCLGAFFIFLNLRSVAWKYFSKTTASAIWL